MEMLTVDCLTGGQSYADYVAKKIDNKIFGLWGEYLKMKT